MYHFRTCLLLIFVFGMARTSVLRAQTEAVEISGQVTNPQSNPITNARVTLDDVRTGSVHATSTDVTGHFSLPVPYGAYTVKVTAAGFQHAARAINVSSTAPAINIQLTSVAQKRESIAVVADVKQSSILFPDPAQRVYIRQETLDANPGRPGAQISIPGIPIETASGGIKAPQYFAPGVAGDHGEPIAQYIQVGSYLVSNNL